ncbi:MAG: hypothetical protein IJZ90_01475 [Clostridia bacterium]|nr:hypothetical protein [Clostridia bacterium]
MLDIIIDDKQYRPFISYAVSSCDFFSLVFENEDKASGYVLQEVYLSIAGFVFDKKGIRYHPDTGTDFRNSDIAYFECNKHTGGILQAANSIYDWNGGSFPEELCFYRNGKIWMACTYHERCIIINNETQEDLEFFKKAGITILCQL